MKIGQHTVLYKGDERAAPFVRGQWLNDNDTTSAQIYLAKTWA